MALPQKLTLPLMQTQWASQLNPVLANELVAGQMLTDIALVNGTTVVNHLLSRQMQGWVLVDVDGAATIYRSAPMNATTLTLTSNVACNVNLWVF